MAGLHGKKRMFVCVLVAGVLVLIAVWSIVYACTVTSVNISVSDESEEDAETNRSPSTIIPVGGTAFFYAECGYNENPNNDGIEWTFDLDGDGTYETTYPTEYDSQDEYLSTTQTHDYDDSGDYTISVKARLDDGEDTWQGPATCDVTVVGVEKVVKEGESNEVGPIFVCLNGEVDLEAIPDTGSTFPDGEPTWEITSRPDPENPGDPQPGSLSATDENATLSDLDVPGDYVIKATCGTSSDTITVTVQEWSVGPGISGACIKKEHNQLWIHYEDSCTLKAKGHDYDDCGGETQAEDYIKLELTTWSGSNLSDISGSAVTWNPSGPSSSADGDSITATIKDDPDNPDGANTDDPDVTTNSVRLIAYEAVAILDYNSSDGTSGSGSVTVTESGTISETVTLSLAHSPVTASPALRPGEHGVFSDTDYFDVNPFAQAKWTLRTNPNGANLGGTGVLRATVGASVSGTMSCSVSDDDFDLSGCPVSISVSAGYGPISVSITPNLDLSGQDCEAQAALAFGFASAVFGTREGSLAPRLTKSSGDGAGEFSQPFSYNPPTTIFSGIEGSYTEALAKIGGKVEAKGKSYEFYGGPGVGFVEARDDSSATMWINGSATYTVDTPQVIDPPLHGPEPGYND